MIGMRSYVYLDAFLFSETLYNAVRKYETICLVFMIQVSIYFNIDMCKFESSQKDESRAQSADSSKAYRKPRALNCIYDIYIFVFFQA